MPLALISLAFEYHIDRTVYVQSQKIVFAIQSRFYQNMKWGAHLWKQFSLGKFYCQKQGKNNPHLKNSVFFFF